ncbi:class I SAM-dependent methyltransferase [Amycolatopsis nigrescens]|uniref:class I SAM-dependent methyltransferase n=1 Tax=Amycolatopsis nigrescens TaxID=381445 RepID=UPI000378A3BE|nr:class I SAM-dependent methyltransferase [Amycolatopsis nigrescens]
MNEKRSDDRPVTVAQVNYQRNAEVLREMNSQELFRYIFETNLWSASSASGSGSDLAQTSVLRERLPELLRRFQVRTLLDLPCGDFGWLSGVELGVDQYVGADIVPELVALNRGRYAGDGRRFLTLDLTADELPEADAVLCRDCLVHLSFADIQRALRNLRRSGSRYLLTTTFADLARNSDIESGDWRPLNLCREPFNFPEPLDLILEGCTEEDGAYADKTLALWEIDRLPQSG